MENSKTYFTGNKGMGHFSETFPHLFEFITGYINQEDSIIIHPITVKTSSYKPINITFNEEAKGERLDWLKMWDIDQNIEDIVIYI